MGNKGAFITLTNDLKPKFTTFEAVVSVQQFIIYLHYYGFVPLSSHTLMSDRCSTPIHFLDWDFSSLFYFIIYVQYYILLHFSLYYI